MKKFIVDENTINIVHKVLGNLKDLNVEEYEKVLYARRQLETITKNNELVEKTEDKEKKNKK